MAAAAFLTANVASCGIVGDVLAGLMLVFSLLPELVAFVFC